MVKLVEGDLIAGVDEVGRGALSGPIVAAATLFRYQPRSPIKGLKDSKQFSNERKRIAACEEILKSPFLLSKNIASINAEEIDQLGIDKCNDKVFRLALEGLSEKPKWVFVDGVKSISEWPRESQWVEAKSDTKYWWVSAASIVAKVWRDQLMCELSTRHPWYSWKRNKGYGTEDHITAIKEHGPTPYHRTLFIRNFVGAKRGN